MALLIAPAALVYVITAHDRIVATPALN